MKGFIGAFLVFTLWAAACIYYISLKDATTTPREVRSTAVAEIGSPVAMPLNAVQPPKNEKTTTTQSNMIDTSQTKEKSLIVSETRVTSTSQQLVEAQVLADEIKKTIAISDTINIDKDEPEQSLASSKDLLTGTSVSSEIFYPQYNNTDLVLDKKLVAYASELKIELKAHPDKKVTIIGHTDNVGNGTDNFKIALRKARQVKWYLTARRGIPRSKVTAISRGEEEPIESNKNKWGRNKNNRIEIIID